MKHKNKPSEKLVGGLRVEWLLLLGMVVIPIYVHRDYFLESSPDAISRGIFALNPFPESAELSSFLAAQTSDQDRIFIFGSEPQILFEAHRRSATPFAMIYPLTRQFPRYLEFQERVWQDILRTRPAYILVTNIRDSLLWDGQAKLTILDHLENLTSTQYKLAGIMVVRAPKGKLILAKDGQLPPEITENQPSIYVYRRAETS